MKSYLFLFLVASLLYYSIKVELDPLAIYQVTQNNCYFEYFQKQTSSRHKQEQKQNQQIKKQLTKWDIVCLYYPFFYKCVESLVILTNFQLFTFVSSRKEQNQKINLKTFTQALKNLFLSWVILVFYISQRDILWKLLFGVSFLLFLRKMALLLAQILNKLNFFGNFLVTILISIILITQTKCYWCISAITLPILSLKTKINEVWCAVAFLCFLLVYLSPILIYILGWTWHLILLSIDACKEIIQLTSIFALEIWDYIFNSFQQLWSLLLTGLNHFIYLLQYYWTVLVKLFDSITQSLLQLCNICLKVFDKCFIIFESLCETSEAIFNSTYLFLNSLWVILLQIGEVILIFIQQLYNILLQLYQAIWNMINQLWTVFSPLINTIKDGLQSAWQIILKFADVIYSFLQSAGISLYYNSTWLLDQSKQYSLQIWSKLWDLTLKTINVIIKNKSIILSIAPALFVIVIVGYLISKSISFMKKYFQNRRIQRQRIKYTQSCSICLLDMNKKQAHNFEEIDKFSSMQVIKTPCNHYYHAKCIKIWLIKSQRCPLDNRKLEIKIKHQ